VLRAQDLPIRCYHFSLVLLLLMEPNQTKPRRRVSQGLLLVGMQGVSRTPTEADLTVAKRSYAEEANFNKEFVEVDSGRFGTQKRKGSENLGRTPVMIGRFARNNWLPRGVPNCTGPTGRMGPEMKEEVTPTIIAKLEKAISKTHISNSSYT
jgi:hypothetical protein